MHGTKHEPRTRSIATLGAALLAASAAAAMGDGPDTGPVVPAPVQALLSEVAPAALPPGRKDTVDTLGRLRVGVALWGTRDVHGGYHGQVAEVGWEHLVAPGDESPIHTCLELAGDTTPSSDVTADVWPMLFEESYAKFEQDDFNAAFGVASTGDLDFATVQSTIFAPRNLAGPPAGGGLSLMDDHDFPEFNTWFMPQVQTVPDMTVAVDIGFANNFIFALGHPELNARYPMLSKYRLALLEKAYPTLAGCLPGSPWSLAEHSPDPLRPQAPIFYDIDWTPILPGLVPFRQIAPSMIHPEVAARVADSLADRIAAATANGYADRVAYWIVGGEYFTDWVRDRWPNGLPTGFDLGVHPDAVTPDDVTRDNYPLMLPGTDYSTHSYYHFGRWLAETYPGATPASLGAVSHWHWPAVSSSPCPDLVAEPGKTLCAEIDPLDATTGPLAVVSTEGLRRLFADWTAFQRHQRSQAEQFHYRVAKAAAPLQSMYGIQTDLPGVDRGALVSDGVAILNFYNDNAGRRDVLTDLGKRLRHAIAYGESINLPIFGMPRRGTFDAQGNFVPDVCEANASSTPASFKPVCWDEDFSVRTLHEVIALGVDSLGVAYWENAGEWTLIGTPPLLPQSEGSPSDRASAESLVHLGPQGHPSSQADPAAAHAAAAPGAQPTAGPGVQPTAGPGGGGAFPAGEGAASGGDIASSDGGRAHGEHGLADALTADGLLVSGHPGDRHVVPEADPLPPVSFPASQPQRFAVDGGTFAGSAGDNNLAEELAARAAAWRTRRAFSSPWRSPLLVHTGAGAPRRFAGSSLHPPYLRDEMTDWYIELLGRAQVQYAAFTERDGLDDLWLTSERELLVSAFVPDLDVDLLAQYIDAAADHGWSLLVLTDEATMDALCAVAPGLCLSTTAFALGTRYDLATPSPGFARSILAFTDPGSSAAQAGIEASLIDDGLFGLDLLTSRPVRPVLAVAPGAGYGGALAPGVEVIASHDGLGLLVAVANTSGAPQSVDLEVAPALVVDPIDGFTVEGGKTITDLGADDGLDEGLGSALRYVLPEIPALDALDVADLADAVDALCEPTRGLLAQRAAAGFDVAAAQRVCEALEDVLLDGSLPAEVRAVKLLAGLTRLERMVLLRYEEIPGDDDRLTAVDVHGDPVAGAPVQLEFPLLDHERYDGGGGVFEPGPLVTDGAGQLELEPAAIAAGSDALMWDFVAEDYLTAADFDVVVELHVQHPTYATHAVLTVELGP